MTRGALARLTFHSINIDRTKEGIHEVFVYCKAHPGRRSSTPFDAYVKRVQQGAQ
jgi:hypothetical protein